MRNLLATTAIAAMMSLPAAAQQSSDSTQTDQTTSNSQSGQQQTSQTDPQLQNRGMTISASDLIQHSVHVRSEGSGAQEELPEEMADAPDTWEDAGQIEDIIMTRDGQPKSVVLNAGEYLGASDKKIETSFDDLRLVRDSDDEGEFFVVYTGDRSKLEQSEDYDTAAREERGDMSYSEQSGSMDTAQAAGGAAAGSAATQSQSGDSTETAESDSSMQSGDQTETAQTGDSGSMKTEEGSQQAQSDTGDTEMETADSKEGVVLNEGEDTQQAESEMTDDQTETAQTGDTETGTLITEGDATEQAETNMTDQQTSEQSELAATTDQTDATATEDRTSYLAQSDRDALTAEDIEGLSVYGSTGEDIGEISELLVSDDGKIDNVVIDVGGFLGIGEKHVSVPFDELKLSRGDGGMMNDLRIDVDYSEDELENMQSWED